MYMRGDIPCVASELALDLPRAHRPAHEVKPGDAPRGLLVVRLVVAHVVMKNSDDVVLSGYDRAFREGKECVRMVITTSDARDEFVVNPYGRRESCMDMSKWDSICKVQRDVQLPP